MRRGKISFRSIFAIILASIFTLISFFFDQQVIQTENKARDLNSDIVIKEKKYEDFYSGYESMLYFIDIVGSNYVYYLYITSLPYKTLVRLENYPDFKKNFYSEEEYTRYLMKWYIVRNYLNILNDIYGQRSSLVNHPLFDLNLKSKDPIERKIKNIIKNLFLLDESTIQNEEDFHNKRTKFEKGSVNAFSEPTKEFIESLEMNYLTFLYKETVKLNKKLSVFRKDLDLVTGLYSDKSSEIDNVINIMIEKKKKLEIKKNYFILLSITSQILGLISILLLFRFILIEKKGTKI